MKKHLTFILIVLAFLLTSCLTLSPGLRRDIVTEPAKITGTYDLILVGGVYADDPDRIAIYDIPGDGYEFQPVTEEYRVKRLPGLSAQIALEKTKEFFSEHCAYNGFISKELTLPVGESIGYEMIPDYPNILCEYGNEISVSYGKADNGVIKVYTRLMLREDDGGRSRGLRMRP
jgi:predicted small secreted protein